MLQNVAKLRSKIAFFEVQQQTKRQQIVPFRLTYHPNDIFRHKLKQSAFIINLNYKARKEISRFRTIHCNQSMLTEKSMEYSIFRFFLLNFYLDDGRGTKLFRKWRYGYRKTSEFERQCCKMLQNWDAKLPFFKSNHRQNGNKLSLFAWHIIQMIFCDTNLNKVRL